jgi:hypothetical protein
MRDHDIEAILGGEMVIDENTLNLKRLYKLAQPINAMQRVEIQAKEELRVIQNLSGALVVLGKHNQITHAWDKLQGLGSHVGRDHDGFFAQASEHVAQGQRRAQGVTVGRLVARDGYALNAIDKHTQLLYRMLSYNVLYHCF